MIRSKPKYSAPQYVLKDDFDIPDLASETTAAPKELESIIKPKGEIEIGKEEVLDDGV